MRRKYHVRVTSRLVEANGWVETGTHYSAMFAEAYPEVKGCPSGRSQVGAVDAVLDLLARTNAESGLHLTISNLHFVGEVTVRIHA